MKWLRRASLALFLMAVTGSLPVGAQSSVTADLEEAWDQVLAGHLSWGTRNGVPLAQLDYSALARGSSDFERALAELAKVDPRRLDAADAMATWINAYNILAVAVVLDHWPVESIRDAGGRVFGKAWEEPAGVVGGRSYSLDEIEHEILRPLGDPRIHAAIVCASVSCPDLAPQAFRGETLDRQLDAAVRGFLGNGEKGLRVEGNTLWVSAVFDWYGEDFEAQGGVVPFLRRHLPPNRRLPSKPKMRFLYFDWALNGG